jgi:hypothetical protein
MDSEFLSGTTLQFSADPRLAAAAGAVARYFADVAGMDPDAVTKLQAATLAACLAAFALNSNDDALLSVEISRFTDRIEVAVARAGETSQTVESLTGVDRIDRETRNGAAITRLTKFTAQAPA